MKLEIQYRENMHGKSCVAPFINGWNVWDIPEQEWTYAVQKAVLHAYEIGWKHCLKDINEKMNPPDTPQNWNDAALRGEGRSERHSRNLRTIRPRSRRDHVEAAPKHDPSGAGE